jgi:hypothetical protein
MTAAVIDRPQSLDSLFLAMKPGIPCRVRRMGAGFVIFVQNMPAIRRSLAQQHRCVLRVADDSPNSTESGIDLCSREKRRSK